MASPNRQFIPAVAVGVVVGALSFAVVSRLLARPPSSASSSPSATPAPSSVSSPPSSASASAPQVLGGSSGVLVLGEEQVHQVLDYKGCIWALEKCFRDLSAGRVFNPLRSVIIPPKNVNDKCLMALMPVFDTGEAVCLKAITVAPGNPAIGKDAHQGAVLLMQPETGELIAMLNASAITSIRTAAASAIATKLLARSDSSLLAVVGTGTQGLAHVSAIACVLPCLRRVHMVGRNMEHTLRTVQSLRQTHPNLEIVACQTVEEAVGGAHVVVLATTAAAPVIEREWLSPGAHINAVGNCHPHKREVGTKIMKDCKLFVDRKESLLAEAGEYILATKEDPSIDESHVVAELGEILNATSSFERQPNDITLFKSLGVAVEDLAAGLYCVRRARQLGVGTLVDF